MTSASDNAGAREYPAEQAADGGRSAIDNSAIDQRAANNSASGQTASDPAATAEQAAPQEHGGRIGPDPTRYGDWEKGGRCIDF